MMRWHLWVVLIADRPALHYVLFALPTFTSRRGRRDLGYAQARRVLFGDNSLGSEVRHEFDLLVCKRPNFLAVNDKGANQLVLLHHWNSQQRAYAPEFDGRND